MKKIIKSSISVILCFCMLMPMLSFFSSAASLGQVKNLKATSSTYSTISLKWDKVSGSKGYRVYIYNSSSKKWVYEKTTSKTTTTVTDLTSAKSYKFRVRAYKGSDKKTFGAYSSTLSTATTPTAVKNIKASGVTTTSFTLSWNAVKRASGYRVYVYDTSSSTWKKMGATSATKCKISSLTAGSKFKFKVCAYYNNGKKDFVGAYSSVLTVVAKPAKVTGLKVMSQTQSSVTLTWNKVNGATSYQIYKYVSGEWKRVASTSSTSYSLMATTAVEKYKVRACISVSAGTLHGSFSSEISASAANKVSTNVDAPNNLALSVNTEKKTIEITWSSVSGANGYQIEGYDFSDGSWKTVGTTTKNTFNYSVNNNGTYYFRVRAYKTVNSTNYYSDFTPASGIEYMAPVSPDDTKLTDLEKFGILGYMYDFEAGCFYNTVDAIHRVAGFTPLYDAFGWTAWCFYTTVRIDFTYSGKDWRVQLWKGQYGPCFVGGEAGVYTRTAGLNVADWYACASDENMLGMSMVVYQNGKKLFTRPYGYYWWCTGYVFGFDLPALGSIAWGTADTSALTMLLRITLKSQEMTKLFCKAAEKEGFAPGTDYIVSGNDVILTWN